MTAVRLTMIVLNSPFNNDSRLMDEFYSQFPLYIFVNDTS